MCEADEISRAVCEHYHSLPRRGKPEAGLQWTLLAAVVKISEGASGQSVQREVVALGTGTKCIGRAAMSCKGDVVNDSHAEVIARRSCVRYLMEQLCKALRGEQDSVFCPADQKGKWKLRPEISFIFFTSHTPCGDASIIPMTDSQMQPCPPIRGQKDSPSTNQDLETGDVRQIDETEGVRKRMRVSAESLQQQPSNEEHGTAKSDSTQQPDLHRTGAKCVPGGPTDPLGSGLEFHRVGLLRVKPGRGEPTLSLSCSDKIARWTVVGFQGALLSHFLQGGLYFRALVVGKCPYSQFAMERALKRGAQVSGLPEGFSVHIPKLLQSSLKFIHSREHTHLSHNSTQARVVPCGAAISWCAVSRQPLDVTANGYKQGVTKKAVGTARARSLISKLELFHSFLELLTIADDSQLPESLSGKELWSYWDYKQAAEEYQQAWAVLRSQVFPLWPQSPRELLLFCRDPHSAANRPDLSGTATAVLKQSLKAVPE
ncbi:tRNA-specific adenosine deaminase 1 [Astyanax mexicanus]|uniref:tRNA-specific adenosine deaminase 1 n=1 Tax=Astyanax mexicanus TaxID=7994 RepID=A0A8T2LJ34_ASTMX|nr:tRNA-specific adenosine deaminase 1 [Astyanax mexicanus]